jgi:hypothetical protein
MNSLFKKSIIFVIFLVLGLTCFAAYASETKTIGKNETLLKSQFLASTDINNEGIIKGDMFAAGNSVSMSGTVEGDLVAGGSNVTSSGLVSGDIISGASDLFVSGPVKGNIRSAAATVSLSGNVGKNVNIIAGNSTIQSTSLIGGNLLVFGNYIRVDGKVKGSTKIDGNRITLSGEFFGDVDINMESPSVINMKNIYNRNKFSGTVTILSGTIIHGKLTYKSLNQADIQNGAKIGNSQWIKVTKAEKNANVPTIPNRLWSFFKLLLSTAAYFLIALLLLKLFPRNLKNQSDLISKSPLKTVGIGIAAVFSTILALIAWVILLALSILFNSPAIGIILGLITIVFYVVLFYLATIPVSLWLGNVLLKDRYNTPARLAAGLATITIVVYVLKLLSDLSMVGFIFSFLAYITMLAIFLVGTGASLLGLKGFITSLRKHDAQMEKSIEP